MCVQVTVKDASSTKKHKRLSRNSEATSPAQLSTQEHPFGSLNSKRKLKAKYNTNQVGANRVKIQQLHMTNSLCYLRYKSDVKAAGESVFHAVYQCYHILTGNGLVQFA